MTLQKYKSNPGNITFPSITPVDKSGSITTGGTSQILMEANEARVGFDIQNVSTGDLAINTTGGSASLTVASKIIAPGALYESPLGGCSGTAITIIGAATGQKFIAWSGDMPLYTTGGTDTVSRVYAEDVYLKDEGLKTGGADSDAAYNTSLINSVIDSCSLGMRIWIPKGITPINGISISKIIHLTGSSMYACRLKNVSANDGIHINDGVERGSLTEFALWGNGSAAYGADSTSGKGITFGIHSNSWDFERIWMRNHGDDMIFADGTGHLNTINISWCRFENGKKSGIRIYQNDSSNQINAIHISNSNMSSLGENGVSVWGQSITIGGNTIQDIKNVGILLDGTLHATGSGHLQGIVLVSNYFEQVNYGFIKATATGSPYPRYVDGLVIEGNYGNLLPITGDTPTKANIAAVEILESSWADYDVYRVSNLRYGNNSFTLGDAAYKAIFDGNNVLGSGCSVTMALETITSDNRYVNLGKAFVIGSLRRKKVVKGITACTSHVYTLDKSPNIIAGTSVQFDIGNTSDNKITGLNVPISTDCTDYTVVVRRKNRAVNSFGAFTDWIYATHANKNGNQVLATNFKNAASSYYEDSYIELTITFAAAVTTFYVGNLELSYSGS